MFRRNHLYFFIICTNLYTGDGEGNGDDKSNTLSDSFYGILDVPLSSSQGDIKNAFRELALRSHPDKNPNKNNEENKNTTAWFQDIREAHEALTRNKFCYDQQLANKLTHSTNAFERRIGEELQQELFEQRLKFMMATLYNFSSKLFCSWHLFEVCCKED